MTDQDALSRTRQQRERLQKRLAELAARESELAVAERLATDSDFQRAIRMRSKLKTRLHRIRQNIQKKGVAIEARRRKLAEIEAERERFQEEESVREQEMEQVLAEIERLKARQHELLQQQAASK